MPLPKRRHSKTRGRKRRSHNALSKTGMSACSRCGTKNEPHRVCSNCGYYDGRKVIEKETA
jgi:large subunit ribosomal protein L32